MTMSENHSHNTNDNNGTEPTADSGALHEADLGAAQDATNDPVTNGNDVEETNTHPVVPNPFVEEKLAETRQWHADAAARRETHPGLSAQERKAAEAEERRMQQWGALTSPAKAAAAKFAAARAALEAAADEAFGLFPAASDADRAAMMVEITELSLTHDTLLTRYAQALAGTRDDRGADLAKRLGYRSLADLLQHELGRRNQDANTMLRLAEVLRDRNYPSLADAVESRLVSMQQAGVIVDVLDKEARHHSDDDVAKVEEAAIDFAVGTDSQLPLKPEQLQKLIRNWFKELQPEQLELKSADQYELREASYGVTGDGMVRLRALLPAEEGAAVMQFLDANAAPKVRFTDPERRESDCCCTAPSGRCDARYSTNPDAGAADHTIDTVVEHCESCEPVDPRTRKQKMADAFSKAFTVAAKTKETSTQGGACPTLLVTISLDEMHKHAEGTPAVAMIQRTEEVVPAHVAARVLCDGVVQAAVTGEDGEVLHLGRTKRLFTPEQRTALSLQYRTCAVGDCDIPSVWCEAHHVTWWSEGGPTDIDNGVLLCNYHHHQVHAGNLDIVRHPNGKRWRVRRKARVRFGTSAPAHHGAPATESKLDAKASDPPNRRQSGDKKAESNTSAARGDRADRGNRTARGARDESSDDDPPESD